MPTTNSANTNLWIMLEDKPSPIKFSMPSSVNSLATLVPHLCQGVLPNVNREDIEFFAINNHINPLSIGTLLADVKKNSSTNPLVIRYPYSDNHVFVRYSFSSPDTHTITLRHNTGMWYILEQDAYDTFDSLQEDDTKFYFAKHLDDVEDDKEYAADSFQLIAMVEKAPVNGKLREINLDIKLRGKKDYDEYTFKEVSKEFAKGEWSHIGYVPRLDLNSLPDPGFTLTDAELQNFVQQLKKKNQVFNGDIPTKATAHEFISIFMTFAISLIQDNLKTIVRSDLQLQVQEDLNGSCGHGSVDYIVKYQRFVAVVNEIKHDNFNKGEAKNIVQMHSALESLNKKRKRDQNGDPFVMYGIVTDAKNWRFLRWTGSFEEPVIEISKELSSGNFNGQMEGSLTILRSIIRVLVSAINP